jgi:hypothetical protein
MVDEEFLIESKAKASKPVIGYQYTTNGGDNYTTYNSTIMPIFVRGLNIGVNFTLSAKAIYSDNSVSTTTAEIAAIIAFVPEKPSFTVQQGYETAIITVTPTPGRENGSPITSYLYSINNGTTYIDTNSPNTRFVINNLVGQKMISMTLKAVNAIGSSEASDELIISNICFPAGTLIRTNQGEIAIEKIDPKIHTIRNKKIVTITKTITQDKYLVCIEKNALGNNIPSEKTIITKNHCIWYNGKMIAAKHFVNNFENVKKVKYNGEILYNVLMEESDKMMVNNLICETLDPANIIAKVYNLTGDNTKQEKRYIINKLNEYALKNKIYK